MYDAPTSNDHFCAAEERCKAYDHLARPKHARPVTADDPLCDTCLTVAEADVRKLLWDFVDLAQMQAPSMSQALNMQPSGKADPPMPLRAAPEALQAEIVHVLTTWETEIRSRARLSDPDGQVRDGAAVQRAIAILAPRLRLLARIQPTSVYPAGCEDDPQDIAGWEAIHHLQHLHQRARGMLGRTHRTRQLPGTCPQCAAGELYQDDPRYESDPCDVYCGVCPDMRWPHTDYEQYVTSLVWPVRGAKTGAAA